MVRRTVPVEQTRTALGSLPHRLFALAVVPGRLALDAAGAALGRVNQRARRGRAGRSAHGALGGLLRVLAARHGGRQLRGLTGGQKGHRLGLFQRTVPVHQGLQAPSVPVLYDNAMR